MKNPKVVRGSVAISLVVLAVLAFTSWKSLDASDKQYLADVAAAEKKQADLYDKFQIQINDAQGQTENPCSDVLAWNLKPPAGLEKTFPESIISGEVQNDSPALATAVKIRFTATAVEFLVDGKLSGKKYFPDNPECRAQKP